MSTEDFQDEASSRAWQRQAAGELVAGCGRIVAEYFDVGQSRRLAWADRPQAAALLAALADPDRGFDTIVIGEYERAFHGDQLIDLAQLLDRHNVQLWLPETSGPVDTHSPTHQALIMLLGASRNGRYSAPGSEPWPRCGPRFASRAVTWVAARRTGTDWPTLAHTPTPPMPAGGVGCSGWNPTRPPPRTCGGSSLSGWPDTVWPASPARSTSAACRAHQAWTPERNRHRSGAGWTLRTVAAILANPRYTGRQVWNRQNTSATSEDSPQWVPAADWVISMRLAHTPLVSEADFIAAQAIRTNPTPADGTTRTFLLAGSLSCGRCGRRMESHWMHGRPGYRC